MSDVFRVVAFILVPHKLMVSDVIPSSEGYATVGSCLRAGGEVKSVGGGEGRGVMKIEF